MVMLPTSGKTGFAIYSDEFVPINRWSFSEVRNSPTYFTSDSDNKVRRRKGIFDEIFNISGEGYYPSVFPVGFYVGWITDLSTLDMAYMGARGIPLTFSKILDVSTCEASWSTQILGTHEKKVLDTNSLFDNEDIILCPLNCEDLEFTQNPAIGEPIELSHIKRLEVIYQFIRPTYYASNTLNHIRELDALQDIKIMLTIEGDWDYWLALGDDVANYTFVTENFTNMRRTRFDNLIVDVKTGTPITAQVTLESA